MDVQRKINSFIRRTSGSSTSHMAPTFRGLRKSQLGGVIFGCSEDTINECLHKKIFGLPYIHITYVKNIDPELPLFLFNYNDRRIHGIFEAASSGALNINPSGWTKNASEKTQFPAQVQIRVRQHCQPVLEPQFKQIIADNYHTPKHFWFELDHAQTFKLISLMSSAVAPTASMLTNTTSDANLSSNGDNQLIQASLNGQSVDDNEEEIIYEKLKELNFNSDHSVISTENHINDTDVVLNATHLSDNDLIDEEPDTNLNPESMLLHDGLAPQLIHRLESFERHHLQTMGHFAQKLMNAETEIKLLKERCRILESLSGRTVNCQEAEIVASTESYRDTNELIFLVGGYDGRSWLSDLNAYSPSQNMLKSLRPMNTVRGHAPVAKLNGELYVFGGVDGSSFFDSAESYNPANNEWTLRPSLNKKKGRLAGASLHDKIYAIGGGIRSEVLDDVEMLDMFVGRWIPTRSMLQRRTALASTELNGAIYAVGGFDGIYLSSVERFDPREASWVKIESMKTSRGLHSVVAFHEKMYVFGGYDGAGTVSSVEIYEPRLGTWCWGEPVSRARSYYAVAAFKDSIYVFGGENDSGCIVDTVECFNVANGWQTIGVSKNSAIAKKSYFSALVL